VSGAQMEISSLSAREIGERAADWIQRRQFWNWSEADQAELDAWLAQSPAHLVAYLRVEAAWGRTERLAALGASGSEAAAPKRGILPFVIGMAAVIVVAVAGVAISRMALQPQDRLFSTPVGGHETVAFADGSKIELNTDTVLRTRMTTNQRTIWLERGEAYFQVKHDAAHPFIVFAGRHRVTDLGTKFLIRRDPGRLEVALLEGRVRFGAASEQSQSALMVPGDVATATTGTMFVTREDARDLANQLGWRHGVLVFRHTTLAAAATEFNRYNRRQLIIADPAAASITIDGTFPTGGVEDFSKLAQAVLGLHVESHGDEIVIRTNR